MNTKTCYNEECPEENPQPLTNFHKQSTGKYGRNARCRVCVTTAQCDREKTNSKTNRRRRNSHYIRKYGITLAQYEMMLEAQDGRCAICSIHEDDLEGRIELLVVDHCHETDAVRDLLCDPCNKVLGLFKEDIQRFLKGALYLGKHKGLTVTL